MTLALLDRVQETTIVTGTGAATLLGAVVGYQAFSAVGNGNTTYYCIADQSGANWEVGIGTYTLSSLSLARNTVLASSNGGALVNFTAGVKNAFVTYPAEIALLNIVKDSATGSAVIPAGTTAQRTASPATGAIRFNTTAGYPEVYNGTAWTYFGGASNPIQQSFSGTGSQTTFTLSQAPGVVAALLVSIGGVNQTAGVDYTLSGTTLTFTTAPVAGTNNINTVNFGVAGTIGVPANASITYPMMANGGAEFANFKNRIINGAMVIDQRNAGASVTTNGILFSVDRWQMQGSLPSKYSGQQNAGSITPPVGFTKYLGITSLSSYSVLATDYFGLLQGVEGVNTSDFNWGTTNAKAVTLSFQVYSSLTGTFGGSLINNGNTRSYPFSYTIPTANTWTTILVTVPGDTTGTWTTDNTSGVKVWFGLGAGANFVSAANTWTGAGFIAQPSGTVSVVGTNGATFYITGVDLRPGTYSIAPAWDYRSYAQELALCQRYYWKNLSVTSVAFTGGLGAFGSSTSLLAQFLYPVPMRSSPSFTTSGCSVANGASSTPITSVGAGYIGPNSAQITINASAGVFVVGQAGYIYDTSSGSGYTAFSAEL